MFQMRALIWMVAATFAGLSWVGVASPVQAHEYRSTLKIVNASSKTLLLDPDLTFTYSPTTWLHQNTAQFGPEEPPAGLPARHYRTITSYGHENYLTTMIVLFEKGNPDNRVRITANVNRPDFCHPRLSNIEASFSLFEGSTETLVQKEVSASGKIFHTDGTVTIRDRRSLS